MPDTANPTLDQVDVPAPSETAAVDAALRRWRGETDRRRSAWQSEQEQFIADQQQRRRRTSLVLASVALVTAGAAAVVYAMTLGSAPVVVPPAAPAIAALDVGTPIAPTVARVAPPQAADTASAPVVPSVATDVRSWQVGNALWLQLDYTGAPGSIRWLDATGATALDDSLCTNSLSGGALRCYIGRTEARVQTARDAGHPAGTWTAQFCQAGACDTVASFTVR